MVRKFISNITSHNVFITTGRGRPDNIPTNPREIYWDSGWAGFGDWLGTGAIAPQNMIFQPFEQKAVAEAQ